ncbi:TPA: hypothetical protein ACH3X1_009022 [Trebouxia sp. C0004]
MALASAPDNVCRPGNQNSLVRLEPQQRGTPGRSPLLPEDAALQYPREMQHADPLKRNEPLDSRVFYFNHWAGNTANLDVQGACTQ